MVVVPMVTIWWHYDSNSDFDVDTDGTVGADTDWDLKFGILANVRMVLVCHCWCSGGEVGVPLVVLWCAEVRVQEFPAIPPPLHLTIPPITSSDFTNGGPNTNYYF